MAAVKEGEVGVEVIILLLGSLVVVVVEAKDHTIGYALKAGADTLKEEVSSLFGTLFLGEVTVKEYRYIEPDKERMKLLRDKLNTSKTVPKLVDLTILRLKNLPKNSILEYPVSVPELKDIIMQAKGGGKEKTKEKKRTKEKEKTKEDTGERSKYRGKEYQGKRNSEKDFVNGKGKSTLDKHASKHGYNSSQEYLNDARKFLEKPPTKTTQSFMSKEGTYFRYDSGTNEFGIINQFGGISTYFKPDNGLLYWLEQIELYAIK